MSDVSSYEDVPVPHIIEAKFFSATGSRTQELVNNEQHEKAVAGRNRWYEFSFNEPVYLTRISVTCEGYANWNKFEFEVEHVDGTRHEQELKVQDSSVDLRLGKLCRSFRSRPERKFLSESKIIKVEVTGFDLDEFHSFEWAIKDFEGAKVDIAKREAAYSTLLSDLSERRTEKAELESEIGKSRAQVDKLGAEISTAQERDIELRTIISDLNAEIEAKRIERRDLITSISEDSLKLQELVREIRLFPSEIAGFVREGNRNIYWYLALSIPFIIILFVILFSIFSNAIDLTQVWKREPGVDVWTIFLTRIPFVLVAVALVEACGYIVGRLIYEIVRINRQRLEFAKLSIIAKDVSAAASVGGEFTESEVFDREIKLKMELLREHMKNQKEGDFEYKGSAITSAVVGVASRLAGGSNQNKGEQA